MKSPEKVISDPHHAPKLAMAAGLCCPSALPSSTLSLYPSDLPSSTLSVEGIISLPAASEQSALFSPDGSPLPAPDPAKLSSSIKINVFHQPTLKGQADEIDNVSKCL
jgi:hypothetical protein